MLCYFLVTAAILWAVLIAAAVIFQRRLIYFPTLSMGRLRNLAFPARSASRLTSQTAFGYLIDAG